MQRYITRIDLLEKFLVYFREHTKSLMEEAKKHKIHIPGKFELAPSTLIQSQGDFDSQGYLKELNPGLQSLSPREKECTDLLSKGYTLKMAGQALNLSPRTIETYVENIKEKLNAHNRIDLIRMLNKKII